MPPDELSQRDYDLRRYELLLKLYDSYFSTGYRIGLPLAAANAAAIATAASLLSNNETRFRVIISQVAPFAYGLIDAFAALSVLWFASMTCHEVIHRRIEVDNPRGNFTALRYMIIILSMLTFYFVVKGSWNFVDGLLRLGPLLAS